MLLCPQDGHQAEPQEQQRLREPERPRQRAADLRRRGRIPDGAGERGGTGWWQFNRLWPILGPVFVPLFGGFLGHFLGRHSIGNFAV